MVPQQPQDALPPEEAEPISARQKLAAAAGNPSPGIGENLDVVMMGDNSYRIRPMFWVGVKVQGRTTHFTFQFRPRTTDLINAIKISAAHYNWKDWLTTAFLHQVKGGHFHMEEGKILDRA